MSGALSVAVVAGLDLALRATLLVAAAWAAATLLRKAGASAAARHMAWLFGIAALLVLPFLRWLVPPLPLPILRPETETATAVATADAFFPLLPAPGAAASASGAPDWSTMLLAAWLIGVAALLLRFAMTRRRVARLWRDAEPARGTAWHDLLAQVSREMRLSRRVEMRIARGPAMPMTWGTRTPRVLLPAEADAWPIERRRLVLLHELAHVARRDSLSRSAASIACALYWFHPGAWLAARQMRLEQEYAADDRVLNAGAAPRSYARSLLDLARRVGDASWPDHAPAMAGMCQLERRVVSITTPALRTRPGPVFLYASAAIAAFVMLAVASGLPVRPMPALSDPPAIDSAFPVATIASEPAEARSGAQAQMPGRATVATRRQGARGGAEDVQASGPQLEPRERTSEIAAPQVDPAAQLAQPTARPDGQEGQEAPAPARQLAVYGPQLPRQIEEQASDPRIPAALRRGGSGRAASSGDAGGSAQHASSRRRTGGTQIWPRLLLSSAGLIFDPPH